MSKESYSDNTKVTQLLCAVFASLIQTYLSSPSIHKSIFCFDTFQSNAFHQFT